MAASSEQDVHGVKFSGRHFSEYGIPGISDTEIGPIRPAKKRLLGEGSFGAVYRLESDLGKFAVKYITFGEELSFGGVMREIAYPGWLSHPGIIKYHDVYMEQGQAIIVMDLMDGDIYAISRKGYFAKDLNLYLTTVLQLVNAVAFLTSHGVMHRDIKPLNILYRNHKTEVQVFLADFGFATGHTCETPPYESKAYTVTYRTPEVLLNMGSYDAKAEVWALGITMYQMMGHSNPFSDRDKNVKNIVKNMAEVVGFPVGTPLGRRMKAALEGMDYSSMSKPLDAGLASWDSTMVGLVLDLVEHMLDPNPQTRYTIFQVADHPVFRDVPLQGKHYKTVSISKLSCVDQTEAFRLPSYSLRHDFEIAMGHGYKTSNVNLVISHLLSTVARSKVQISQTHYILSFHLFISLLSKTYINLSRNFMRLTIYLLYAVESFLDLRSHLSAEKLAKEFLKATPDNLEAVIADIREHAADTARVLNFIFPMSTPANILASQNHKPLIGILILLTLDPTFYCENTEMITTTLYNLGEDLAHDRSPTDNTNLEAILTVARASVKRLTPAQKAYLAVDLERYQSLGLL